LPFTAEPRRERGYSEAIGRRSDLRISRRKHMSEDLRSKGVKNEVTGAAKEAEGKIRDAAADITGDDSENLKAKAKTAEGKIQKNFGKAQQDADDSV
jgi:uncharacterized protein YjbJ (UPF0337 family)